MILVVSYTEDGDNDCSLQIKLSVLTVLLWLVSLGFSCLIVHKLRHYNRHDWKRFSQGQAAVSWFVNAVLTCFLFCTKKQWTKIFDTGVSGSYKMCLATVFSYTLLSFGLMFEYFWNDDSRSRARTTRQLVFMCMFRSVPCVLCAIWTLGCRETLILAFCGSARTTAAMPESDETPASSHGEENSEGSFHATDDHCDACRGEQTSSV